MQQSNKHPFPHIQAYWASHAQYGHGQFVHYPPPPPNTMQYPYPASATQHMSASRPVGSSRHHATCILVRTTRGARTLLAPLSRCRPDGDVSSVAAEVTSSATRRSHIGPALPCLETVLSYLALLCPAMPCLALSCLAWSCLVLPCLPLPCFALLDLPCLGCSS